MSKVSKTLGVLGVAFGLAAASEPTDAATIVGNLSVTSGNLGITSLSFSAEVDALAPDLGPPADPFFGLYALDSLTFDLPASVGGPVTFTNGNSITLDDNGVDVLRIDSFPGGVNFFFAIGASLLNPNLISGDAIPFGETFQASDFDFDNRFALVVNGGLHGGEGTIDSLEFSALEVSEPGALAALGIAAGTVLLVLRRKGHAPQPKADTPKAPTL